MLRHYENIGQIAEIMPQDIVKNFDVFLAEFRRLSVGSGAISGSVLCVGRFDSQGMNVGVHEITNRVVNQPMDLERAKPVEAARLYFYAEMTSSVAGAGVPHVQVAFVDNFQFAG